MSRRRARTLPTSQPVTQRPGDGKSAAGAGTAAGIQAFREGRLADAKRIMQQVLKKRPREPAALQVTGLIAAQEGRLELAERTFRRAVGITPESADAHNNLANALLALGRYQDAEASYRQALALAPSLARSQANLGRCLQVQGRLEEAKAALLQAIALDPRAIDARVTLGNLLRQQGALDEAAQLYQDALKLRPGFRDLQLNLGNIERLRGNKEAAERAYRAVLAQVPNHPRAALSLAALALERQQLADAQRYLDVAATAREAVTEELLSVRALLADRLGDAALARTSALQALQAPAAGDLQRRLQLTALVAKTGGQPEAIAELEQMLSRSGPDTPGLLGQLVAAQQAICDWRHWDERVDALTAQIKRGDAAAAHPFDVLLLPGLKAPDHQRFMRAYACRFAPWLEQPPLWQGQSGRADARPHIGFISSDFYDHATARLVVAAFEHLDREQFRVTGYAIGPSRADPVRARVANALEGFVDLSRLDDRAAARRIAGDGVDILVDLNGYAQRPRTEILAQRPARIQASWLGFAGTMGASFIDYLIADPVVIPSDQTGCYDEAVVYLPHCYQPWSPPDVVPPTPTRSELGLPNEGFVFCSFNNPAKLTPSVFDVWCAILNAVPEAVLWLFAPAPVVRDNLSRAAEARGISANRLVFAGHCPQERHLVRLRCADLVLDTWPCGAHTTARDALAVGVPVVTLRGDTFASKVAASLLLGLNLYELVCDSVATYQQTACELAEHGERLSIVRRRLAEERLNGPIFRPDQFAQGLEQAFQRVLEH